MELFKKKRDNQLFRNMDFNFVCSVMVDSSLSDDELVEFIQNVIKVQINEGNFKIDRVTRSEDGTIEDISLHF